MDISKVKNALQDLIIRLQDAEKGFAEIEKATSITSLKERLSQYSEERHKMHKVLESQSRLLGGDPEVKTSILGDLHRMFIDIKINNVSYSNEVDAIVDEIERGSSKLIEDYDDIIENIEMSDNLKKVLTSQKLYVVSELEQMKSIKNELNAVNA